MKHICGKDQLQKQTDLALKLLKHSDEEETKENTKILDFIPRTFVFPEQREKFNKFSKKHGGCFIAKPSRGS